MRLTSYTDLNINMKEKGCESPVGISKVLNSSNISSDCFVNSPFVFKTGRGQNDTDESITILNDSSADEQILNRHQLKNNLSDIFISEIEDESTKEKHLNDVSTQCMTMPIIEVINKQQYICHEVQTEIKASEIEALQGLVVKNKREKQKINKKLAETQSLLTKLKTETLQQLQSENEKLRNELAKHSTSYAEIKVQIEEIKGNSLKLEADYKLLKNENEGLKLKVKEYSAKLEEEQENNETLSKLTQEMLERYKEEFTQYKKKLNEANAELSSANKEINDLRNKIEEYNRFKQTNRELVKLNNKLEYYKALARTQEEKYAKLRKTNSELREQLAKSDILKMKSKKDVKEFLCLIGYKGKSIEELRQKLEELQKEPRTNSNFSQYKSIRADGALNTNVQRKSQQITSMAILSKVNVIVEIDSFIRSC